jgi:hypothetical protein
VQLRDVDEVVFPSHLYGEIVAHARRKLAGRHLDGEERAPKAFGLVGGRVVGHRSEVTHVFALRRNARDDPHVKEQVDRLMDEFAVRSETPLDRRGWVTDPRELMAAERECERAGAVMLGGYHMHRVPWEHDPLRDTCTELDTKLAEGSGLWMFILSMVDPERPVLRAFFEGRNEREAAVRVAAEARSPAHRR